ncbi:MAG: peptidase M28 family protein, partial [Candidatus Aminicenantes bacterium]|nr:peptidase M28 family protein [Candidatus Aminicenantes bacterium]
IGPLGQSGTLLIGLIPDSQRYFDVHHSALDTIETVNSRELEMGAIAIALLAYILAQEGIN